MCFTAPCNPSQVEAHPAFVLRGLQVAHEMDSRHKVGQGNGPGVARAAVFKLT